MLDPVTFDRVFREHQQHRWIVSNSAVDLFLQTAGSGVMHVPPEADAFGVEMIFHFFDEGAIRVAVGDEKRGDLERLPGTKVMNLVQDFVDFLIAQHRVV